MTWMHCQKSRISSGCTRTCEIAGKVCTACFLKINTLSTIVITSRGTQSCRVLCNSYCYHSGWVHVLLYLLAIAKPMIILLASFWRNILQKHLSHVHTFERPQYKDHMIGSLPVCVRLERKGTAKLHIHVICSANPLSKLMIEPAHWRLTLRTATFFHRHPTFSHRKLAIQVSTQRELMVRSHTGCPFSQ